MDQPYSIQSYIGEVIEDVSCRGKNEIKIVNKCKRDRQRGTFIHNWMRRGVQPYAELI